jgi:hypothetical protein
MHRQMARHRQILRATGRHLPTSLGPQSSVLQEHCELIACVKSQVAAQAIAGHVNGSGRHIMEPMRLARLTSNV